MKRKFRRKFGRGDPADMRVPVDGRGLIRRWHSIRIGHRAMIALFGGMAVMPALWLVQSVWQVAVPVWLSLLSVACMVAGLLYAYTRRCPSCGAGDVITMMAPQRSCKECGTMFLNDRWF